MTAVRAVRRWLAGVGARVDQLVLGRDGTRFEHMVILALAIAIFGNGLALTWIQADRHQRIVAGYQTCQATRERTIRNSVAIVRLADLAEDDGSPRFAGALRELVGARFDKEKDIYVVAPPPPCPEP